MQLNKFNLRLRWRTRFFVLCAIVLLGSAELEAASGRAPQDGGDYAGGASGGDIIEQPLLEDIVESAERHAQNENENENESTDRATDMTPALNAKSRVAGEHENKTQRKVEDQQALPSSEEYYEETSPQDILKNLMRNIVTTNGPAERASYANDGNASDSAFDYSGEEVASTDTFDERTKIARRKKTFVEPPPRTSKGYRKKEKSYDDSAAEEDGEDINAHQEERFMRKQKQLLPKRQPAPNFSAQDHYVDESRYEQYDDEENDDDVAVAVAPLKRKDQIPVAYGNQPVHAQRKQPLPPLSFSDQWISVRNAAAAEDLKDEADITSAPATPAIAASPQSPAASRPATTSSATATATTTTTTSTMTAALPAPNIPYGSTLPTPLAAGAAFEPTNTRQPTGLPATPETLAVAKTTTAAAAVAAATNKTTTAPSKATKTKPTTTRPGGKQGKQINILRRKLQPHEKLRNYFEDAYIRMPLAVIVDPSSESLEKTKALWRDALRTNFNIKIVLVSLNASGSPAAYSFNNTKQFLAGLNSIKEQDGGDAFIGIVHASELVPYDSAVFISTAALPPHTELVQDAAITLLKKRIRLYLIWFGERSLSENETQESVGGILGEVAIRSGGDILHIVGSENSQELEVGNTLVLVADAFRGAQEIEVPVDTTLSSLHVRIDAPTRTVTLETPNGG